MIKAGPRPQQPAPLPAMAWIPPGTFLMGSDRHYPEEAPARSVAVDGFWMDVHSVTNADFRRFVAATGHVTLAERPANPEDYPGAQPALLAPASVVFTPPRGRVDLRDHFQWWSYVPGACWRRPRGPGSTVEGLDQHPVVHVSFDDAAAYAAWVGKALPTEAEWERAARGGLEGAAYAWGDELEPGGRVMAKIWQGEFPGENRACDGHDWTAPVGAFPANGYGLFDMTGNVWEWTTDWYEGRRRAPASCCAVKNPTGGARAASVDPCMKELAIPRKVTKGGSFLCAPNYCRRYRPAARMAQPIDTTTCHLGFRCILRPGAAIPG
jgi:sulfatase modifying factor 1